MGITRRPQRGQVLVVFALVVTSILGVIGLLYTFSLVLAQRRALQTAADSASLRGTWQVLQELATDDRVDLNVLDRVNRFATANGLSSPATNLTAFYVGADGLDICPRLQVGTSADLKVPVTARGVQVVVQNQVATILPGFLKGLQAVRVEASATATARPVTPTSAGLVLPIAVLETDMTSFYGRQLLSGYATYDLFAPNARTLDLTTTRGPGATPNPALSYGSPAVNAAAWSDGKHTGTWQMAQPGTVDLAVANIDPTDLAYHTEIATGLGASLSRQALPADATGARYALVMVPVYRATASPSTVAIIGFAQFKIRSAAITANSAVGTFSPRAIAPYGAVASTTPTHCLAPGAGDFGSALVNIVL